MVAAIVVGRITVTGIDDRDVPLEDHTRDVEQGAELGWPPRVDRGALRERRPWGRSRARAIRGEGLARRDRRPRSAGMSENRVLPARPPPTGSDGAIEIAIEEGEPGR